MHPVIADALAILPSNTDTPRTHSYAIPEGFAVNPDTLRFTVHIRTNTRSYQCGWASTQARLDWQSDLATIMGTIGFARDTSWFYPSDGSTSEYLHGHPDDISGVITLPRALTIYQAIEQGDYVISNRNIDVYEVLEDLDQDELERRLAHYEGELKGWMIDRYATTRTYKFKRVDFVKVLESQPGLSLLGRKSEIGYGASPLLPVIQAFVDRVHEDLVKEGWLIIHRKDDTTFYRSANKTEQRVLKLRMPAA